MRVLRSELVLLAGCLGLWLTGDLRADVVRLQRGGELRGELLEAESAATSIRTLSGARVIVDSEQIDFVQRRSLLVEEYVTRSRQIGETIEEHWNLAEWCRMNQLLDERREQLERILDLNPDHADARRILGYVEHQGRWMTREDMMAERGYVRHQGRWVTRQELDLLERNETRKSQELAWMSNVRLWSGWLTGVDGRRQSQGLANLQQIRDPAAISALSKFLADHPDAGARRLFINILSQLEGSAPVPPLVKQSLWDVEESNRRSALTAIGRERFELALPALMQALQHPSNEIVLRAAVALGEIGDERAVTSLIDALVTSHSFKVQVPASGISFSAGGTLDQRVFSGALPPDLEIQARTGQLPYGVRYRGDPTTPVIMKTVNVRQELKNGPVLAALEKITGQNFGFNERNWHLWWAVEKG